MSVSPFLKEKYGIPNVCRKKDLPRITGIIYAVPRMSYYLTMSARVVSIFLDYVAREDLHVYSVDESFLNLGPYLSYYQKEPEEIVHEIQDKIYRELGLTATAGIGPNMFLAKIALDNEGKKNPPYIAHWSKKDIEGKLWKINPLTKLWGINTRTASHLHRIGIHNVKELATAPLELLENEFGIMGDELHNLANGIDGSNMQEEYTPKERNLSIGQTLMRDYSKSEARLLIKEMCDDLTYRLRKTKQIAGKISLFVSYSSNRGTFMKETSLPLPTDCNEDLCSAFLSLYEKNVIELPIRGLSLSIGKLSNPQYEQSDIFTSFTKRKERKSLYESLDAIQELFGKNSVLRCSSLKKHSTIKTRHAQIGGHKK